MTSSWCAGPCGRYEDHRRRPSRKRYGANDSAFTVTAGGCHTRPVPLRVDVLGTPRIEVDGAPLGVDTRKATALLAYLAVRAGPQSRELLVDLLWPDADPDRGRAALRRTLSTLRSALGRRWVTVNRSAVGWTPTRMRSTSAGFGRWSPRPGTGPARSSRSRPRWRCTATTSWPGSACATASPSTTGSAPRPESCGRSWSSPSTGSWRRWPRPGAPDEAVPHAQRRLALDPLHEPAHRSLIRLYAAERPPGGGAEPVPRLRARARPRAGRPARCAETSELYDAVNEGRLPARRPAARRPRGRGAGSAARAAGRARDGVAAARRGARGVPRRRPAGGARGRGRRRQDAAGRGAAGRGAD